MYMVIFPSQGFQLTDLWIPGYKSEDTNSQLYLHHKLYGPKNLKYLLYGHLKKKFADPYSILSEKTKAGLGKKRVSNVGRDKKSVVNDYCLFALYKILFLSTLYAFIFLNLTTLQ